MLRKLILQPRNNQEELNLRPSSAIIRFCRPVQYWRASFPHFADAMLIARNARYFNCPPAFVERVRNSVKKKPGSKGPAPVEWLPSVADIQVGTIAL
jgi:hypothetical protein